MLVDISFNPKQQSAILKFKVVDFTEDLKLKECLAILTIVGADFYLDPELEIEHLEEFISVAKAEKKTELVFEMSEDGLELELN